jgi:hypothetical protein
MPARIDHDDRLALVKRRGVPDAAGDDRLRGRRVERLRGRLRRRGGTGEGQRQEDSFSSISSACEPGSG